MVMKKLAPILVAISILVFYLVVGAFITDNHKWMLFATLSFTFIIGYIVYNTGGFAANRKKFLLFVLPICILFLGTMIFQNNSFVKGFPYILFIPLVSFAAIFVKRNKSWWAFFVAIPVFAFIGLVAFPNWFSFYVNFNSHVEKDFPAWGLVDKNGQKVILEKDKIVVLDLWNKHCGACIRKMPAFEEEYLKYKNHPEIAFYSVYVRWGEDTFAEAVQITDKFGYAFKTIYSEEHDSIVGERLGFEGYPQLFILKNGKLRYDGQLVTDPMVYVHSLENEIERLLD